MSAVGFEPMPFLTGDFNQRLRPLDQACVLPLKCRVCDDRVGVQVGYTLERTTIDRYTTELVNFVGYSRYLVG